MIILKNAKEKKNTPHTKCGAGEDAAPPSWCVCHHWHPHRCCPCLHFHLVGGCHHLVLLPLTVAVHGAPGCPVVWPDLGPCCCFVAVSILALPSTLPHHPSLSLSSRFVVVLILYPCCEQVLAAVACVCLCCLGTISW